MIVVIGWITIESEGLAPKTREVTRAHACTWLTSNDDSELNAALARAESHLSRTLAQSPEWDGIEWTGFPDNHPDPLATLRARLLATAADSSRALAALDAAARKVDASIATYRAGDIDHVRIARAINRIEDRASKPEIVGSRRARSKARATVRRLREALDGAEQAHVDARAARYAAESKRIADEQREARTGARDRDPAFAAYQEEVRIAVARRSA